MTARRGARRQSLFELLKMFKRCGAVIEHAHRECRVEKAQILGYIFNTNTDGQCCIIQQVRNVFLHVAKATECVKAPINSYFRDTAALIRSVFK